MFELVFTASARQELDRLERTPRYEGLVKQIKKSSHPYASIEHPYNPKEKVFEAYAQNKTPSAYRIFWCYGPQKRQLTILAITPHP